MASDAPAASLRALYHDFRQLVWERRRKKHEIEMITAKCMRDLHRERYAELQSLRRNADAD